jgi:flagellar biosynthesis/type III secretory pathway M-ring protein FliF/YscJ
MTAGTCLVTLLVTFVFNWFTNRPKIRRQREEEERKKREQEQEKFRAELKADVQAVHDEALKQNDQHKQEYKSLSKIILDIKNTNKIQNLGLQAVLKDVLKIRYLE